VFNGIITTGLEIMWLGSENADILDMQKAHKPTSIIRYLSAVGRHCY